jgi:hypothetical protein
MAIEDYIDLVPDGELAGLLRESEEDVLGHVRGNITQLQACYRIMCRRVVLDERIPGYAELPLEMQGMPLYRAKKGRTRDRTVSRVQFQVLFEQLEAAIREIGAMFIRLQPPVDSKTGNPIVKYPMDEDAERERRVGLYETQWTEIERQYDEDALLRGGPAATPIWCFELKTEFPSARKAADFLRTVLGKVKIRRSDIRTALRRAEAKGQRTGNCADLTWAYMQDVPAQILRNGRERPVRCVSLDRDFGSLAEAAAFAGVSHTTMREACDDDGQLDEQFQWADAAVVAPVPTRQAAFDEMFPLLALAGVSHDGH